MQQKLDEYIQKKQSLEEEDLFEQKVLALIVELSELANETRSFKFWSLKTEKNESAILEEYVDCLHFILSLGIEKGHYFNRDSSSKKPTVHRFKVDQFNQLFEQCIVFKQEPTKENYFTLFEHFLHLGTLLGYDEKDIHRAYFEKNKVNFSRQDEGY